jgi:hypothetical protein
VEILRAKVKGHLERWIYYGARELSDVGERDYNALGSNHSVEFYTQLRPVKVVVLLDFDFNGMPTNEVVADASIRWDESPRLIFHPLLSWTFVSLDRFQKQQKLLSKQKGQMDPFNAWLHLLTRTDGEEVLVTPAVTANDKAIADGYKRLSSLSPKETKALELSKKNSRDVSAGMSASKEEGMKEGRKQGCIPLHCGGILKSRPLRTRAFFFNEPPAWVAK